MGDNDSDFNLVYGQAKDIRSVLAQDPNILSSWKHIKHDFLVKPVDLYDVDRLLKDGNGDIQSAIQSTLEKWISDSGTKATFMNCVAIIEAKCPKAAEELKAKKEEIRKNGVRK